MFSFEEKRELLVIAREAIGSALQGMQDVSFVPTSGNLLQPGGAFVTIRVEQELRGCIGYIESDKPLASTIAEVAVKSATEDPRFAPLTLSELEQADLEISILSPLRCITDVREIVIGVHGLVISMGTRRGLLLPQVAVEHALDRETFFEATIRKAGLPLSVRFMPELKIFVFEAEVIHEADILQ